MFLKNCMLHLQTVLQHKKKVFLLCRKAGMPLRGILHDLSKFSPEEFVESAKYYQGDRSPILACKEKNGYSMAWLHHRSHNKHHAEYWVDSLYLGGVPIQMPYVYNMEMICDIIAASMTYNGNAFTRNMPYDYWNGNLRRTTVLHPYTKEFTARMLRRYAAYGESVLGKKNAQKVFAMTMKDMKEKGAAAGE